MGVTVREVCGGSDESTLQHTMQACGHITERFTYLFAFLRTRLKRRRWLYAQGELPVLL
jgi:hypothetical protein